MNKKTEIVKSIILTLLVATSVVLFTNSWIRQWDYEGETTLISKISAKLGFFGDFGSNSKSTDIISPSSVVLTSGAKRIIINKGTEEFSSTYGDALSVFLSVSSPAEECSEITEDKWFYAQKNHSVYMDFGVNIKNSVFELGSGCYVPEKVKHVSSVVLTTNGSATNKLVVYYRDGILNKYYMQETSESAEPVEELLNKKRGYKNIPLAAELGFNSKPEDDAYGQQITIEGNVPIILEGGESSSPVYKNIKNAVTNLDNRKLNKLLNLFGMSGSSANRYADKNGTAMYIDSQGTLKFYDDGKSSVIEYEAANSLKGAEIELANASDNILYDIVRKGYEQVYSACGFFGINEVELSIASDITDESIKGNGELELKVNYCINGIPVYFMENNIAQGSAQMVFNSKGNLVYYKQRLYNIGLTDGENNFPAVLNAIDELYNVVGENYGVLEVEKIFRGYYIDEEEQVTAVWCIKLYGNNDIYIVK